MEKNYSNQIKLEFPLLRADQIEAKVKKVTEKGVNILLYKTARTDMDMLDDHPMIGPANWTNDYREIKGNMYCGIAVNICGEWIWKWDCGTESRADGEGNEKKGEASDAFKRAGFRWGIGRELYTSPFIFAKSDKVEVVNNGGNWRLKNPFERFKVAEISYDSERRISGIVIVNSRGVEVFKWGDVNYHQQPQQRDDDDTPPQEPMKHDAPLTATQYQINMIKSKLEAIAPLTLEDMRNRYGQNLERLSRDKAGEALVKIRKMESDRNAG